MRGITEERLREKINTVVFWQMTSTEHRTWANELLNECQELNPWQPIDDNTPNDRQILLFYPEYKAPGGHLIPCITISKYDELSNYMYWPTHWQELPSLPGE